MLGVKGALALLFESALNLTSRYHVVFEMKNKSRVAAQCHTEEETRLLDRSQ